MAILSREVWVSRFASELTREQPLLDRLIAKEASEQAWQHLKTVKPEKALHHLLQLLAEREVASRLIITQRDVDQLRVTSFLLDAGEDPPTGTLHRLLQLGWLTPDPGARLGLAVSQEGQNHLK